MPLVRAPLQLPGLNGGRLTTQSGVAVSTADRTAQGTIYWTPFRHGGIMLPVSSSGPWRYYEPGEISLALTVTSGNNYDVFGYLSSGTLALELSAAWTNDTTRADALGTLNGVQVKNSDKSRLYLGTLRASGANVTADSGEPAAGTTPKRFLWNCFNRVPRLLRAIEDADSWTYSTNTWRSANNDTTNRVEFVIGLAENTVQAMALHSYAGAAAGDYGATGVGVDSTSANSAQLTGNAAQGAAAAETNNAFAFYAAILGVGYHFLQWLETWTIGAGTGTWYGDAGLASNTFQSGIKAEVWG